MRNKDLIIIMKVIAHGTTWRNAGRHKAKSLLTEVLDGRRKLMANRSIYYLQRNNTLYQKKIKIV